MKVNYLLFHLMIKYRNPWPYRVFSVSPAMTSCSPLQQDRSTELSQAHYSSFWFGFLCTCCLLFLECLLDFCKPWKCLFLLQCLVLIFPTPMKTITILQPLSSFCAFIRLYFNGLHKCQSPMLSYELLEYRIVFFIVYICFSNTGLSFVHVSVINISAILHWKTKKINEGNSWPSFTPTG